MPIVLKTNFIDNKNFQTEKDEVPISKKWIPIYPEVEKNKSTGPKWKAIGQSNLEKTNNEPKINSHKEVEPKNTDVKIGNNSNQATKYDKNISTPSTSVNKNLDVPREKKDFIEKPKRQIEVIDLTSDDCEKDKNYVEDMKKKIRLCKHGRVIKKEKQKESINKKQFENETNKKSKSMFLFLHKIFIFFI